MEKGRLTTINLENVCNVILFEHFYGVENLETRKLGKRIIF